VSADTALTHRVSRHNKDETVTKQEKQHGGQEQHSRPHPHTGHKASLQFSQIKEAVIQNVPLRSRSKYDVHSKDTMSFYNSQENSPLSQAMRSARAAIKQMEEFFDEDQFEVIDVRPRDEQYSIASELRRLKDAEDSITRELNQVDYYHNIDDERSINSDITTDSFHHDTFFPSDHPFLDATPKCLSDDMSATSTVSTSSMTNWDDDDDDLEWDSAHWEMIKLIEERGSQINETLCTPRGETTTSVLAHEQTNLQAREENKKEKTELSIMQRSAKFLFGGAEQDSAFSDTKTMMAVSAALVILPRVAELLCA